MKNLNEEVILLKYKDVLERIKGSENHLLLGNGFNYGLGVNTGYANIFEKMIEGNFGLYKDAKQQVFEDCKSDLELFIGHLQKDINSKNSFLQKFVSNKIKLDFMKATYAIVKSSIKNVYAEKQAGVYLLLKSFTNYFTLNYDPLLYLLLLYFKSSKDQYKNAIAIQPSLNFIKKDMDTRMNNIYLEVKHARDNGKLVISGVEANKSISMEFRLLNKEPLIDAIVRYFKNDRNWKKIEIEKVVDLIREEEKKHYFLNKLDDGFRQRNFDGLKNDVYNIDSLTQNIFFLHGAFHIYKDKNFIKKVTKQTEKALYNRLEEILNNEELDIVCVFQPENKKEAIEANEYLKNCLNKLSALSGSMVIIGSSLADNDNHIFEKISNSKIDTIYISAMTDKKDKDAISKKAKEKFPNKTVHLFEAESISYELPEEQASTSNTASKIESKKGQD